jgi:glucoamylase
LQALEAFANEGGMIPEQVWDAPDIPERELFFGKPSGSAMPLVWAHAEYLKLRRSLRGGGVFDMPPQPVQRYQVEKVDSPYVVWRFNQKCRTMPAGKNLRLEVLAPAMVHWSADGWHTVHDTGTRDTGFGLYLADLPTDTMPTSAMVDFTFYWPQVGRWENADYCVVVG